MTKAPIRNRMRALLRQVFTRRCHRAEQPESVRRAWRESRRLQSHDSAASRAAISRRLRMALLRRDMATILSGTMFAFEDNL